MDEIINIKINGNILTKDGNLAGTQYECNSTKLRLMFDENWDGFGKTITFWNAVGENPVKLQLGTDRIEEISNTRVYLVPIPGEAMTEAGECTFVIEGVVDGIIKRTVSDKLKVKYSPRAENAGNPESITPDLATQIRNEIDGIVEDIAEVKAVGDEVNAGLSKVDDAVAMAQSAEQSAIAADNSAWSAVVDAEKARDEIAEMTVMSETLPPGSDATVEKSKMDGVLRLLFGIPEGNPGVYIGSEEPTDPDIKVWIETDGEPDRYATNLTDGEGIDSLVQMVCDPENEAHPAPVATGVAAVALGRFNEAHGKCSMAVNYDNVVNGTYSFACCHHNEVNGNNAFASGYKNFANGNWTVANGVETEASGNASFTYGEKTVASGEHSFAGGKGTEASGAQAHTEGNATKATGVQSHAEGNGTKATAARSHAEGGSTVASGEYSHAEGRESTSSGTNSHAGGYQSESAGNCSFAHGYAVQTNNNYQAAFGNYNLPEQTAVLMIGYGSVSQRKNVFTVYRDSSIKIGNTKITEAQLQKLLALSEEMGDISTALDELHAYAETLKGGEA